MSQKAQTLSNEILEMITTEFDAPEQLTADIQFEDMGFDSLVLSELTVKLADRFEIELTVQEVEEAGSVNEAAKILASRGVQL